MRSLSLWLGPLLVGSWLGVGCGGSAKDPVATTGSGRSSGGAGGAGGSPGTGAGGSNDAPARGGSINGAGAAGSGNGATAPATSGEAGGAAEGDAGAAALVDCDARNITCKRAAPPCDTFHVPRVEGSCYGDCVKIDRCVCSGPEQCPDNDQYTCWSKTHCGPYVQ